MGSFKKFLETRELTKSSASALGVLSDKWREENDFGTWVTNVNKQLRHYIRYLSLDHTPGQNPSLSIEFNTITRGLRHNLEGLAELIDPASIAGASPQEAIQRIISQDDIELLTHANFIKFYEPYLKQLNPKSTQAFTRILQFIQEVVTQFRHWSQYYQ